MNPFELFQPLFHVATAAELSAFLTTLGSKPRAKGVVALYREAHGTMQRRLRAALRHGYASGEEVEAAALCRLIRDSWQVAD